MQGRRAVAQSAVRAIAVDCIGGLSAAAPAVGRLLLRLALRSFERLGRVVDLALQSASWALRRSPPARSGVACCCCCCCCACRSVSALLASSTWRCMSASCDSPRRPPVRSATSWAAAWKTAPGDRRAGQLSALTCSSAASRSRLSDLGARLRLMGLLRQVAVWFCNWVNWSFSPFSRSSTSARSRVLLLASVLRAGNGEFRLVDLPRELGEVVLRGGARGDGFGQRLLRGLRLLLQVIRRARGFLQVLQVAGERLARDFGALQSIVELIMGIATPATKCRPQRASRRSPAPRSARGSGRRNSSLILGMSDSLGAGRPGRRGHIGRSRGREPSPNCASLRSS